MLNLVIEKAAKSLIGNQMGFQRPSKNYELVQKVFYNEQSPLECSLEDLKEYLEN